MTDSLTDDPNDFANTSTSFTSSPTINTNRYYLQHLSDSHRYKMPSGGCMCGNVRYEVQGNSEASVGNLYSGKVSF